MYDLNFVSVRAFWRLIGWFHLNETVINVTLRNQKNILYDPIQRRYHKCRMTHFSKGWIQYIIYYTGYIQGGVLRLPTVPFAPLPSKARALRSQVVAIVAICAFSSSLSNRMNRPIVWLANILCHIPISFRIFFDGTNLQQKRLLFNFRSIVELVKFVKR